MVAGQKYDDNSNLCNVHVGTAVNAARSYANTIMSRDSSDGPG